VLIGLLIYFQCCTTVEATAKFEENKNDPKIICHYHLQTGYAPGSRDYSPEVIDETHCTHIIYTDLVRYTNLSANRPLHDGKQLFYSRIPEFRKKGINVSIKFYNFNAYEHARYLGDNATERARFVLSLVEFMERNNFNGFDVFWSCNSCSNDHSRDVNQDRIFIDFMRQLSETFKPRGFLLSTFAIVDEDIIHLEFDVQNLSEYVDWMAVSSTLPKYKTSLIAPLYSGNVREQFTVNWTVNYLIEKGVPPSKLVVVVSTIGGMYELTSANENGLNATTNSRLIDDFYKICSRVKNYDWIVVHKPDGSYAYSDNQWISYHDVEDVQCRAEYIVKNNLGGGSFLILNDDDFEGSCGCGNSPLLKALVQVLRNVAGPKTTNCT